MFDADDMEEADPLFWWYRPRNPDQLFAPAVDSHDGSPPNAGESVYVDHWVIAGDQGDWGDGGHTVDYSDDIPESMSSLLPTSVTGLRHRGYQANGDFILDADQIRDPAIQFRRDFPAPNVPV